MRIFTISLLFIALFACKNKPTAEETSWRELVPDEPITTPQTNAITFTDTILVSIRPKDFAAVLKEKPNMPILDFRSPELFKRGHVWRSINMDPADKDFKKKISALSRNSEYAVYCQTGTKSFEVAEEMKRLGVVRIYHLQTGLMNWGESGQALQLK